MCDPEAGHTNKGRSHRTGLYVFEQLESGISTAPQAPGSKATRGKCRAPAERQRASWRAVRRVSENYSGNLAIWFEK
ncbi:hypothetical protein W911_06785 [Hyphomicrobium nitrativorans NL23]|uniref:Uncharacterized protein n=1 Tax=Hyphomicrobium nitrativorans NL23 TaxID=1029756 RepID=V5SHN4_9HYPH|nr:hypothetical protein W911_06785 [Hyphomicrobium nitrativorans NL23]